MMKYVNVFLWLSVMILFPGCEKSPIALKSSGPYERRVHTVGQASNLVLLDEVDLVLSDSVPREEVWLSGGKYLLDWISTEVISDTLFVGNENRANWLRDYRKRPQVKVNAHAYRSFVYEAAGDIVAESPISRDSLSLLVQGGGGSVSLQLHVGVLRVENTLGTVDINLRGEVSLGSLYGGSYGPIYAQDLKVKLLYMMNAGFSDIHVRSEKVFSGEIQSSGNVYVYGKPKEYVVSSFGSGQFIRVEE
ncbi:MAG: hypothetical protein CSA95_03615 [Bacteroidetes bacterium]|nr:MAG: hypothetical protein CSA95_03615 [Bacteroidota bacterium]PIE87649.1 MAG: hypothetical protein CSA04_05970 [Bacteroidota bacterium]